MYTGGGGGLYTVSIVLRLNLPKRGENTGEANSARRALKSLECRKNTYCKYFQRTRIINDDPTVCMGKATMDNVLSIYIHSI